MSALLVLLRPFSTIVWIGAGLFVLFLAIALSGPDAEASFLVASLLLGGGLGIWMRNVLSWEAGHLIPNIKRKIFVFVLSVMLLAFAVTGVYAYAAGMDAYYLLPGLALCALAVSLTALTSQFTRFMIICWVGIFAGEVLGFLERHIASASLQIAALVGVLGLGGIGYALLEATPAAAFWNRPRRWLAVETERTGEELQGAHVPWWVRQALATFLPLVVSVVVLRSLFDGQDEPRLSLFFAPLLVLGAGLFWAEWARNQLTLWWITGRCATRLATGRRLMLIAATASALVCGGCVALLWIAQATASINYEVINLLLFALLLSWLVLAAWGVLFPRQQQADARLAYGVVLLLSAGALLLLVGSLLPATRWVSAALLAGCIVALLIATQVGAAGVARAAFLPSA